MTEQPKWMPSDEEMDAARVNAALLREAYGEASDDNEPIRALITAAVERALAERERVWISALKEVNGEVVCHRDFREMWAKAESNPTYWAELLRLSMQALRGQEARHEREVIEARIDEIGRLPLPIQEESGPPYILDTGFMWKLTKREHDLRAELAALEVKS